MNQEMFNRSPTEGTEIILGWGHGFPSVGSVFDMLSIFRPRLHAGSRPVSARTLGAGRRIISCRAAPAGTMG